MMKQVRKTFKYRIYPNKEQQQKLAVYFGNVRFVYNYFLNERKKQYEQTGKSDNYYTQCKKLTSLKNEEDYSFLNQTACLTLQYSIKNLEIAYTRFFTKKSGFPKLNEYASLFAETGIIGLVVFLLPGLYLLSKLKTIILSKNIFVNKLPFIMFAISLLGVLASGFSAVLNAFYCYWVLLGLGYAMCFGKENDVKDNGDTGSRQEH